MKKEIKEFIDFINSSKDVVVLTGAGISTLSGIPDFRSANGVYSQDYEGLPVEEILSIDYFYAHPDIFYKWCKDVWFNLDKYEPNAIHRVLAILEQKGIVKSIYTQNIDMLDFKAGSKNVYELHGSPRLNTCTKCGKKFPYKEIAKIVQEGAVPKCQSCGSLIKPDIILYGESLNQKVLSSAFSDFSKAKVVLVLGTSLSVQPASSLPQLSLENKAKLIIINQQGTYLDDYAFMKLDDLKETFEEFERVLGIN